MQRSMKLWMPAMHLFQYGVFPLLQHMCCTVAQAATLPSGRCSLTVAPCGIAHPAVYSGSLFFCTLGHSHAALLMLLAICRQQHLTGNCLTMLRGCWAVQSMHSRCYLPQRAASALTRDIVHCFALCGAGLPGTCHWFPGPAVVLKV